MKNAAHIARGKSQERARRDELIKKYAYLAKLCAHRLAMRLPPSVNVDDLISAGIMGLLDAIEKYDEGRGVKFRTYAEFRIRGAMLDELRSMDWVPRSVRKKVQEIEKAVTQVEKRENRPADADEIAAELGVDMDTYQDMLSKAGGIELVSLDEPLWSNDNTKDQRRTHVDLLEDGGNPDQDLMDSEFKQVLAQSISTLSPKEQQILSLYYKEELTLKEVGEVMGLTESRICQIHTQCMIKLRAKLKMQEARM